MVLALRRAGRPFFGGQAARDAIKMGSIVDPGNGVTDGSPQSVQILARFVMIERAINVINDRGAEGIETESP